MQSLNFQDTRASTTFDPIETGLTPLSANSALPRRTLGLTCTAPPFVPRARTTVRDGKRSAVQVSQREMFLWHVLGSRCKILENLSKQ
jgi:hypothetical protein